MATAFTIRRASVADVEFVIRSNQRLAAETEALQLDERQLRQGVLAVLEARAPGEYFIAERHGEPVGQLGITYEWSDWRNRTIWWIQSVYVESDARGRGAFRALYAHVRGEALRAGAGGLRLYVDTHNRRAQQVYAALGMNGNHYQMYEDMFQGS
ncbi:MAG: GNAT family N-acetyltransferase [Acidobacteriaceae bacterium]|jgi:GNAT superfamily N-acetyltransferase|nr:GNAT family N-acetyltransferase [Acidobacteriaceae bacterium]